MNTEQERAEFEAWLYLDQTKYDPERMSKQEIEIAKLAYQAGRAALQSQGREIVVAALETAQKNIGPLRPVGSSDPDSNYYNHDSFMWDFYQRAIDHARRVEGEL